MKLDINPIEFFGTTATCISVFSTYDDMESLYIMNVTIQSDTGVAISNKEIKIDGQQYKQVDWNSTEDLIDLIESQCNITIKK